MVVGYVYGVMSINVVIISGDLVVVRMGVYIYNPSIVIVNVTH